MTVSTITFDGDAQGPTDPPSAFPAVAKLRSLQAGATTPEIEAALRSGMEEQPFIDAISRARLRAETVVELTRLGVASPAAWANAALDAMPISAGAPNNA